MKKVLTVAALAVALGVMLLREARAGDGVMFAYYPGLRELSVRVDSGVQEGARAEVWQRGGNRAVAVQALTVTNGDGSCQMGLPQMEDGDYELRVFLGAGGEPVVKGFKHKNFAWLGNTLGESDVVYPPFTPIAVSGNRAGVVLRDYTMNGFGLWDSVVSEGKEILAGPIVVRAETDAGEESWQFGPGAWTKTAGNLAVYQAEARSSALQVRTTSSLEYDGCMKVEMDLLPGERREALRRLWVEIPIREEEAPLFHYTAFNGLRWNYAGEMPHGGRIRWDLQPPHLTPPLWNASAGPEDGVLWTCRDTRPDSRAIATDFVPYIWLGGGERGLAFFGENDKGYIRDPNGTVEVLERRGKALYLRIYLVNAPWTTAEPRHVVFGLQASPTRPMPANWRQAQRIPATPGPVVCWGGYICADKYPDGHNFGIVDAIENIRRTGTVNNALFSQLDRNRAEPWKTPWGKGGPWLDDSMKYFMRMARSAQAPVAADGRAYPYTLENRYFNEALVTYFEEHSSDVTTEEWEVYQDEWRGTPVKARDAIVGRIQPRNAWPAQQNFPPSYQDFCLYYANEWMKRGVGLYFDNVGPVMEQNPRTSDAYVDERGEVQPASPIWEQRRYYQRIWTRMMGLVKQGNSPYPLAIVQHETNTRVLPLNTWNDASLDLEWTWDHRNNVGRTQDGKELRPFPHGLLLAETAGRQTGSIPHALYAVCGVGTAATSLSAQAARCEWGMRAVHEILPIYTFTGFASFQALERLRSGFGYGDENCLVFNYWDDVPAVRVGDGDVKWLLLARPKDKALFLVLQSWHTGSVTVRVALDTGRIGFVPEVKAWDAESGDVVACHGESLDATLPGAFGTRVIRIGGGK